MLDLSWNRLETSRDFELTVATLSSKIENPKVFEVATWPSSRDFKSCTIKTLQVCIFFLFSQPVGDSAILPPNFFFSNLHSYHFPHTLILIPTPLHTHSSIDSIASSIKVCKFFLLGFGHLVDFVFLWRNGNCSWWYVLNCIFGAVCISLNFLGRVL